MAANELHNVMPQPRAEASRIRGGARLAAETIPCAIETGRAAFRVRAWLLDGPAQLRDGAQSGGVAERISDGDADDASAEMTGQFLHWISGVITLLPRPLLEDRAARAVDWVARYVRGNDARAKRIHLRAHKDDSRNHAVLFFDLAMLLRGLCAVDEAKLASVPDIVSSALIENLTRFVSVERIRASLPCRADHALPVRSSTMDGPFLVKAASHVLYCASRYEVRPALLKACSHEISRWVPSVETMLPGLLHPTLSFAEGALAITPERAAAIAMLVRRCLSLTRIDRVLVNSIDDAAVENMAKTVRLGILLRRNGLDSDADNEAMQCLAEALVRSVQRDGSISPVREKPNDANVRCAIVAEQALRWYAQCDSVRAQRPLASFIV
jgi:hypothetical protein